MKDAFLMMSQQEHDDYTRELENKLEFLTNTLMNYNTMTSEDIDTLLLTVNSTSLTLKEDEVDDKENKGMTIEVAYGNANGDEVEGEKDDR